MQALEHAETARVGTGAERRELLRRIRAEFAELPGLCLTPRQAARLWNLDLAGCECILGELADAHAIVRTDDGRFAGLSWRPM